MGHLRIKSLALTTVAVEICAFVEGRPYIPETRSLVREDKACNNFIFVHLFDCFYGLIFGEGIKIYKTYSITHGSQKVVKTG